MQTGFGGRSVGEYHFLCTRFMFRQCVLCPSLGSHFLHTMCMCVYIYIYRIHYLHNMLSILHVSYIYRYSVNKHKTNVPYMISYV